MKTASDLRRERSQVNAFRLPEGPWGPAVNTRPLTWQPLKLATIAAMFEARVTRRRENIERMRQPAPYVNAQERKNIQACFNGTRKYSRGES